MAQAELNDLQRLAVDHFGKACVAMFTAMGELEAAEVDIRSALQGLPGSEEGRSMWDELPAAYRMML